jgi:hypothetical protein
VTELAEIPLIGGRANVGSVVRIGDEVARPTHPQSPFVAHFLEYLQNQGCDLGPTPLGSDDQGRQRLRYIPGQAPTSPYPSWAFDEGLLVDVAERQRDLQRAARDYVPPSDATWAVSGGNYFPAGSQGTAFCHNDLCLSNVIVEIDTRRVSGFVDFDYVAPVDRRFDIAVLARHWVPFGDENAAEAVDLDRVHRFQIICDVHELDQNDRAYVVAQGIAFLNQARTNVRALADGGNVGFQQMIANGYEATNRETVAWITDHTDALTQTS